ncbi:uncharacterized protein A4U43_C02F10270, partial [Asparagus officinalis]
PAPDYPNPIPSSPDLRLHRSTPEPRRRPAPNRRQPSIGILLGVSALRSSASPASPPIAAQPRPSDPKSPLSLGPQTRNRRDAANPEIADLQSPSSVPVLQMQFGDPSGQVGLTFLVLPLP